MSESTTKTAVWKYYQRMGGPNLNKPEAIYRRTVMGGSVVWNTKMSAWQPIAESFLLDMIANGDMTLDEITERKAAAQGVDITGTPPRAHR